MPLPRVIEKLRQEIQELEEYIDVFSDYDTDETLTRNQRQECKRRIESWKNEIASCEREIERLTAALEGTK